MSLGPNSVLPIKTRVSTTSNKETSAVAGGKFGGAKGDGAADPPSAPRKAPWPELRSSRSICTDFHAVLAGMSRLHRDESSADQDPQTARRLAMKRRAECVVAALVDAISAPIDAEELLALAAGEEPGGAQAKAKSPTERFETGLSTIRSAS